MLAAALKAEVAVYAEQSSDQVNEAGRRLASIFRERVRRLMVGAVVLGAAVWAWVVPDAVSPVVLVLGGRGWGAGFS
jgi:hypothetical protein